MSKKKPDRTRTTTTIRHDFTSEEWREKTTQLTEKMKNVELEEEAVKAQAATARAQIKRKKAEVNDLANQLRNGYENREVEAQVEFNVKRGVKKYYHFAPGKPHHGDFIREDAMTEQDRQALLPLEEQGKPDKPVDYSESPAGAVPEDATAGSEAYG